MSTAPCEEDYVVYRSAPLDLCQNQRADLRTTHTAVDCRRRADDADAIATGIHDLNISGIFCNIAKAWIKFAEMIERNDLDDTDANEVRNHIETAEERVLGARLAIAEAKELIANADKLLSQG